MARFENLWCEECDNVHWVQVVERDSRQRVTKTVCLGKDYSPVRVSPNHYVKHSLRGYDVIRKMDFKKLSRLPKTIRTVKISPLQAARAQIALERKCLAEITMSVRGKIVAVKVFDNATPNEFYEFFFEVGTKPQMIKPRSLGKEKAVHIQDLPSLYKAEGNTKLVYHNKQKYEKLLMFDPNSIKDIQARNDEFLANLKGS
jgi:hypothetical protein